MGASAMAMNPTAKILLQRFSTLYPNMSKKADRAAASREQIRRISLVSFLSLLAVATGIPGCSDDESKGPDQSTTSATASSSQSTTTSADSSTVITDTNSSDSTETEETETGATTTDTNECVTEGDVYFAKEVGVACCDGLVPISVEDAPSTGTFEDYPPGCGPKENTPPDLMVCARCGDSTCGTGE